jgi:hypothetical protein
VKTSSSTGSGRTLSSLRQSKKAESLDCMEARESEDHQTGGSARHFFEIFVDILEK